MAVAKWPANNQRQGHHADLHDIGAMVETRRACARRHGDAQLLPQPLAAVGERFDRRAQDVLHEHDARIGRHQDAFRRQRAVADVTCVLVEHRHGRDDLAEQAQRRVHVQVEVEGLRDLENARQPRAFDGVADQRERGALESIDPAGARVVGVAEVGEPADAFAEGEIKARRGHQRVVKPQRLDEIAAGGLA